MNRSIRAKRTGRFFVYMVRCKYGTYYSGYTLDLETRIEKHNSGKGAKYLRGKSPVELVYSREYRYLGNALRAERNLKNMTRTQKEALIGSAGRDNGVLGSEVSSFKTID